MRVLAIADSDSYVKWGAALVDRLPASWGREFTVLATPTAPSGDQLASALAGTRSADAGVAIRSLDEIAELVRADPPEVVLLSLRGPAIRVVIRAITAATVIRPVFVSGLPGISIPATRLALSFRSQADVVVLHSRREIRAFRALTDAMGIEQRLALATLPFLTRPSGTAGGGDDVIFAAQAKVPWAREDRLAVLRWLAESARRNPDSRVVVKLRALPGEQQTHAEQYPYDELLRELDDVPANLVIAAGPMSEHLARARALVTVSSTAAIEAAAFGVPVLALDDFGVSGRLINLVFEGSGMLGGSGDLIAQRFRRVEPSWLADNYFHPADDEDWIDLIRDALTQRATGVFPLRPQYAGSLGGRLRHVWDRKRALGPYDRTLSGRLVLLVGMPARAAVRAARRLARRDAPLDPTRDDDASRDSPLVGERA